MVKKFFVNILKEGVEHTEQVKEIASDPNLVKTYKCLRTN